MIRLRFSLIVLGRPVVSTRFSCSFTSSEIMVSVRAWTSSRADVPFTPKNDMRSFTTAITASKKLPPRIPLYRIDPGTFWVCSHVMKPMFENDSVINSAGFRRPYQSVVYPGSRSVHSSLLPFFLFCWYRCPQICSKREDALICFLDRPDAFALKLIKKRIFAGSVVSLRSLEKICPANCLLSIGPFAPYDGSRIFIGMTRLMVSTVSACSTS